MADTISVADYDANTRKAFLSESANVLARLGKFSDYKRVAESDLEKAAVDFDLVRAAAGYLGINELWAVADAARSVVQAVADGRVRWSASLAATIASATQMAGDIVTSAEVDIPPDGDHESLVAKLRAIHTGVRDRTRPTGAEKAADKVAPHLQVRNFMTREVHSIQADDSVDSAARCLPERGVSGLPVVDADRVPVGIITELDLLVLLFEGDNPGNARVGELMTRDPHTFDEKTSILTVADFFLRTSIRRVPITRDGILCGIIARRDIIRLICQLRSARR